ncbi:unnamed protein product [Malus baccata var. baccata]
MNSSSSSSHPTLTRPPPPSKKSPIYVREGAVKLARRQWRPHVVNPSTSSRPGSSSTRPAPTRELSNYIKLKIVFLSLNIFNPTKWGKGTGSFRKSRNKTHTLCERCGHRSSQLQKSRCSACAYPAARLRKYNWSEKALVQRARGPKIALKPSPTEG